MAVPAFLLKLGASGIGKLVKRLRAKKGTDYQTPKLFKRIQLGGLLATGTGLIQKFASPEAEAIANDVVGKSEVIVNNGSELIQLMQQVNQVNDPAMAWALIVGGVATIIIGRLPKVAAADGITPKK